MSRCEGTLYMRSSISSSRMIRRPRAPTLRFERLLGDRLEGLVGELELDALELQDRLVLPDQAVLGLVEDAHQRRLVELLERRDDRQAADELRDQAVLDAGLRAGRARGLPWVFFSRLPLMSAPKPSDFWFMRRSMTSSRPTKAPPQMKRMLVVSICRNSWCGCLRPPCGGTLHWVPSRILSSACCTPSPETSRVIDGLSLLRQILSTSSM